MSDDRKETLVAYVKKRIAEGVEASALRQELTEDGWPAAVIDDVYQEAGLSSGPPDVSDNKAVPASQDSEAIPVSQPEDAGGQEVAASSTEEDTGSSKSESTNASTHTGFTGILIIILFMAGIGAAVGYGLAHWSPGMLFSSPPSVHDVIDAHRSVESFTYDVEFSALTEFSTEAESQQQLMSTLMFVPGVLEDGEVPESLTTQLNVAGTASLTESTDNQTNITLGIGTDDVQDLIDVEYRRVADENYLRGSTLPDLGMINLQPMEGEWLSLGGVAETAGGAFGASNDLVSATDTDDVHLLDQVSPETRTELQEALLEEEVYTIKSDGEVQLDDGTDTYLFNIRINPDAIQRYVVRMEQIVEDNDPELLNSPMYSELQNYMTDGAEFTHSLNLQDDQIQVWIDQDTHYIRRLQATAVATEEMLADFAAAGVTGGTLTFTLNLSNYNQPVQVDVPTDVKTFEEAQQIIMSAGQAGADDPMTYTTYTSINGGETEISTGTIERSSENGRAESRNARRQTDLAKIRTALELYRNDNGTYNTGLTSADGREEQQSVLGEYMDSVPSDPSADEAYGADYVVETSADGYCVSAPAYDGMDFPDNNTDCSSFNYSIGPGI